MMLCIFFIGNLTNTRRQQMECMAGFVATERWDGDTPVLCVKKKKKIPDDLSIRSRYHTRSPSTLTGNGTTAYSPLTLPPCTAGLPQTSSYPYLISCLVQYSGPSV